ncbi:hypothetical protein ACINK0_18915 (plasmid) [Deinococcus sp. VB343]|uniref:hypothetical protein n=1 Tax=Deinococcus sp. VB343 TaxID=3385567 RepID=UPI0039C90E42
MKRPLLLAVFLPLVLTACVETETPDRPASLTLFAQDAGPGVARIGVLVTHARAFSGTWSVRPSPECGGPDGPVFAAGSLTWHDEQHGSADVLVRRSDLVTVQVQTDAGLLTASDCITP